MNKLQEARDLEVTVPVSARRFEESPFVERTDSPGMVRGVYAGRFFPIFMGDDPIKEYWCLRRKALIFDVPEKPVEISGSEPGDAHFLILSRRRRSREWRYLQPRFVVRRLQEVRKRPRVRDDWA